MPLIFCILALFAPRLVMILVWLFTSWFEGVYSTVIWPVLGFLLMPMTTLWFAAVQNWFGGEWSLIPVVGMVASILFDLSPTTYRSRRVEAV